MWWMTALALAHGDRFAVVDLSLAPDDPRVAWGATGGWGVVRLREDGAPWEWWCESGLGVADADAVLAWSEASAWVGTDRGVLVLGPGCEVEALSGFPEGGEVRRMARFGEGALALVRTSDGGGVVRCEAGGCVTEPVWGSGLSPRSVVVEGSRAWATLVDLTYEQVQTWALLEGVWDLEAVTPWIDGERFLLRVDGDRRLLWRTPLSGPASPALLYSADGGLTERVVLEVGSYADPPPALLLAPDGLGLYLGIEAGRTWYSADGGASWAEVSEATPVLRCGDTVGGRAVACTDHWADGFDVARLDLGAPWLAMGCLDAATPSGCAAACAEEADGLEAAGAFGGGQCLPEPAPPGGCSTAPGPSALACLVPGLVAGLRRRRRYSPG